MLMGRLWKRLLTLSFTLIVVAGLLVLLFVVPVLTTEIDPNLMRPQCPGGKDWDSPGSSCHDGLIVDYMPPIVDEVPVKSVANKRKRTH